MAIEFREKAKRQRNLLFIFSLVMLVTIFILWRGYFSRPPAPKIPETPEKIIPVKKVEIDFSIFQNPILQELEIPEKILPFEEKIGRENPFLPVLTPKK